jgi:hypothetical protein
MNFEELKFENPGVLNFSIPPNIYNSLKQVVAEHKEHIKNNKLLKEVNSGLAGQIENEFELEPRGQFKLFLSETAKTYSRYYNYFTNENLILTDIWVNFQKKHEYNPLHFHSGILSFVIFMEIPFIFAEEDNLPNTKKANIRTNGRFGFTYNTYFNSIKHHTFDINKSYEGKMFLFPSQALHNVYPFYTSDNFRVTIAGNFDKKRD